MQQWVIRRKDQKNDYWRSTGDAGWAAKDEATIYASQEEAEGEISHRKMNRRSVVVLRRIPSPS